jgi:hypothetical protein
MVATRLEASAGRAARDVLTDDAAGGVIIEESPLVRFEKQMLHVPRGQHKKLPV